MSKSHNLVLPVSLMTAGIKTTLSVSRAESRSRVLALYRSTLRSIPTVFKLYEVYDLSIPEAKTVVRDRFRQFRDIDDLAAIDKLRWETELVTVQLLAKHYTESHFFQLMRPDAEYFARFSPENLQYLGKKPASPFLSDFYSTK